MKYFDKSFFKFTLGFLAIVLLSLLVIAVASAYAAGEISQIVFTTDSQTIQIGELSKAITVQLQDNASNSVQTLETLDLTFESTSGTGEFLGSSGKPASKTMSKKTANRTFYYRDSNEGSFTISVTAKGRDSGKEWSANQSILVSSDPEVSTKTEAKVEPKPQPKSEPPAATTSTIATTSVTQASTKPEEPKKIGIVEVEKKVKQETKKEPVKQAAAVEIAAASSLSSTSPTSSLVIYEAPKKEGWLSKLWHFLKNIFS